jgi:hypothetical protein
MSEFTDKEMQALAPFFTNVDEGALLALQPVGEEPEARLPRRVPR